MEQTVIQLSLIKNFMVWRGRFIFQYLSRLRKAIQQIGLIVIPSHRKENNLYFLLLKTNIYSISLDSSIPSEIEK